MPLPVMGDVHAEQVVELVVALIIVHTVALGCKSARLVDQRSRYAFILMCWRREMLVLVNEVLRARSR